MTKLTELHRLGLALSVGFLLAGLASAFAIFRGARFGQAEWEVAAFGELSVTIVIILVGLGGVGVVGLFQSRRRVALTVGVGFLVVGVVCAVGALLVLTNLPLVWQVVSRGVPAALKVATVKSIGLLALYAIGSWMLSGYLIRSSFVAR